MNEDKLDGNIDNSDTRRYITCIDLMGKVIKVEVK